MLLDDLGTPVNDIRKTPVLNVGSIATSCIQYFGMLVLDTSQLLAVVVQNQHMTSHCH